MKMRDDSFPVDFVMTWVDDADPKWREEYLRYKGGVPSSVVAQDGASEERFRNWDNLRYWFRGVENYAPWVNKIYFVTCGQRPAWLNVNHPKLVLVDHKDYIPEKYLPVFSSHPIELNLYRIKGLSEHFVYFNDDIFILNSITKSDFFVNGQPREMAVEFPLYSKGKDSFEHILMNMSGVLNSHFAKKRVIKDHWKMWFSPIYGRYLINNICMQRFGVFSGILTPHFPSALQKSRMESIWNELHDDLDMTCSHRFRSPEDINQYIFRFWNIMTGQFSPTNFDTYMRFFGVSDNNVDHVCSTIEGKKYKIVCLNDSKGISHFEESQSKINSALQRVFPNKSEYELQE